MGITLKQLKKRAPEFDPEKTEQVTAWVQWMKENGEDSCCEISPNEFRMETDLLKAFDMLDKMHLGLLEVHKMKIGRAARARVKELMDELGEFLDDLRKETQDDGYVM